MFSVFGTVGKEFGDCFHFVGNAGYQFPVDHTQNSSFFYTSLHLDKQVAGWLYPLIELNWFHYTSAGTQRPTLNFEGRDLANVGSNAQGRNELSIAPGFRYKFNDYWQMGIAAEFPLLGTRDLLQYRLGVDLIWRY